MSRVQRPSQKVIITDPFSGEPFEAPTTDFDENQRRADKSKKESENSEESE
jgi:hypothetical protein